MPHRRQVQKGSFGSHLDELVKQFPGHQADQRAEPPHERSDRLQEKIDIHALLFEQAWAVEPEPPDRTGQA